MPVIGNRAAILKYLREADGYPTVREVAAAVGAAISTAHHHLLNLERAGLVCRGPRRSYIATRPRTEPPATDGGYDPLMRFRCYRVRRGVQHEIAGCETKDGIGTMLVQLHEDGEFDGAMVGLLDTVGWEHGEAGVWIVLPYAR